MIRGISIGQIRIVALGVGCFVAAATSLAQSTSPLTVDAGSTATVSLGLEIVTESFGTLSDSDSDTVSVTGTATASLFPTDLPFTHATMQRMRLKAGTVDLTYCFDIFCFIRLDVTVSDVVIQLLEPVRGAIDAGGHGVFPDALLRTSGEAHIVSAIIGVDQTEMIDITFVDDFAAVFDADSETISVGGVVIPGVAGEVDPSTLPAGVSAIRFDLDTDVSDTTLSGSYSPALIGDADADGDIDLDDYGQMNGCYSGPDVPAVIHCGLVDFDGDGDVDLIDFAEFQVDFEG